MLIGIGKNKQSSDVVDLLLDCHVRIRTFSALALRIATEEQASEQEIAEAASKVRRYFTVALPRHVEDEEESVLPRLRGKDPILDRALAAMEEEHESHEEPLSRVVAICAGLSREPETIGAHRVELKLCASRLVEEFERHLLAEEEIILPAIRERLSREDREEMLRELRGRRADIT